MLDLTDFEVLVSSKPKPYTITFNKNGNITLSKELSEDISSNIESATAGFRLHYNEREKKLFLCDEHDCCQNNTQIFSLQLSYLALASIF